MQIFIIFLYIFEKISKKTKLQKVYVCFSYIYLFNQIFVYHTRNKTNHVICLSWVDFGRFDCIIF